MLSKREIERRMQKRRERLEKKYGPDELAKMKLDNRTVDEVYEDLGDEEYHRRKEDI